MKHLSVSKFILQTLAASGEIMIGSFLFPHPKTRMARALLGMGAYPSRTAAKRSFSSMLSHLKNQGLVRRRGPKKQSSWAITAKGRRLLRQPPASAPRYTPDDLPPEDGIPRLITFDIPEKHRKQRQWLRTTLISCGFKFLQRSVFLGWRPIPEDVIQEINRRRMSRYIHIVSVQKTGTLPKNKQQNNSR